jgi:hypothetical protein
MKKMPLTHIVILFLLFLPLPLVSQSLKSLDWQIQFLSGKTQESKPINEAIYMENGSEFRFVIETDADSYCYVVCYTSDRELIVLHDQALRAGTAKTFGPLGVTEPSGTEAIYVIVSLSRQTNLENLIETYKKNQGSRQYANNLYHEVVNLQNTVSGLGEPASTIISSGGTTRSVGNSTSNNDQNFATKFSGKEIYVRPITIRH